MNKTILKNKYQLQKMLGQGGMGKVYLVVDTLRQTQVAVKQIILREDRKEMLIGRSKREYNFLSSINHPNVVKAIDLFEENDEFFLVLEYIHGISLIDFVKKHVANITLKEQLAIAIQIVRAVEAINITGIIHRDIKPGNIMFQLEKKIITILDLGIARCYDDTAPPLTNPGEIIGTPEYMSPEQVYGQTYVNSDVFSLGVLLYQFFIGQELSPFYKGHPVSTMNQICTANLPPLIEKISTQKFLKSYQSISKILAQAMLKEPSQRLSSAKKLARFIFP